MNSTLPIPAATPLAFTYVTLDPAVADQLCENAAFIKACQGQVVGDIFAIGERHLARSKELYKGQRNREKRELWKRFRHPDVIKLQKTRFFALFDDGCFKCGSVETLDMDHHIPMALGGHLVAGNLVALCRSCNNQKRDNPPENFYSRSDLERLAPLLVEQEDIFDFKWDWNFWDRDRFAYLMHLGLSETCVNSILHNSEYEYYMAPRSPGIVLTVEINISDALEQTFQRPVPKLIPSAGP